MTRNAIRIPNNWTPRAHQIPLLRYFAGGGKRAVAVWHRRAGKDSAALNWQAIAAHRRVGTYWHMLPTARQGRKVIWEAIDRTGRRVIDQAFPKEIRVQNSAGGINNTDMKIELACGSIFQVVGSDSYDSLVGSNPVGVVFSEYSIADPSAWDYIRPILLENGGWSLFVYTPRGRNHGYTLRNMAKDNSNWFYSCQTIHDTGLITPEMIEEERQSGMAEEMIQQEYFCSFDAGLIGAFYGREMEAARADGRITDVPYNSNYPVHTFWDLGLNDSTAIWFLQFRGSEVFAIDYLEEGDRSMQHFIREVKGKEYVYGSHNAPFDIKNREFSTGLRRIDRAMDMGLGFQVVPKISVLDGIDLGRAMIKRARFDAKKCERGILCLEQYQKKWSDRMRVFGNTPLHNWASNGADAWRYAAVSEGGNDDMVLSAGADWDAPPENLNSSWII